MRQHAFAVACLSTCLVMSTVATAAEKTVRVNIKSVDAANDSIQLDDIDLDVTRKTTITVDGKKGTLADIKAGQKATVIYDDDLEVAKSITIGEEPEGDEEATAKAMKALQGEWVCVTAEEIGKVQDKKTVKQENRRVTIKGHTFTMTRTKNRTFGQYTGKFEINSSKGHFDFIGKGPNGAVNEWIGIYELDGDTLKVCYRYKMNDDCTRPEKFKADDAQSNICVFYTYKRDNE